MPDEPWAIGKRRWQVTIALRTTLPDSGTGVIEALSGIAPVWANIVPIGAMTFYGAVQTDMPITHRMWVRWMRGVDERHVVVRITTGPDGVQGQEMFRIRRVAEDHGRKRFLMIEAELEGLDRALEGHA